MTKKFTKIYLYEKNIIKTADFAHPETGEVSKSHMVAFPSLGLCWLKDSQICVFTQKDKEGKQIESVSKKVLIVLSADRKYEFMSKDKTKKIISGQEIHDFYQEKWQESKANKDVEGFKGIYVSTQIIEKELAKSKTNDESTVDDITHEELVNEQKTGQ